MVEYLQVTDKNNRPLSKKVSKKEVHEQSLWHRTVHIWVLDSKGRLLLVRRGEWKRQDPGKWASYIGGHVLYGESFVQAATRETREEISIKVSDRTRFLSVVLKRSEKAKEYTQLYFLKLDGNEKIAPSKKEFIDYKLVEPALEDIKAITDNNLSGGNSYLDYQISKLSEFTD